MAEFSIKVNQSLVTKTLNQIKPYPYPVFKYPTPKVSEKFKDNFKDEISISYKEMEGYTMEAFRFLQNQGDTFFSKEDINEKYEDNDEIQDIISFIKYKKGEKELERKLAALKKLQPDADLTVSQLNRKVSLLNDVTDKGYTDCYGYHTCQRALANAQAEIEERKEKGEKEDEGEKEAVAEKKNEDSKDENTEEQQRFAQEQKQKQAEAKRKATEAKKKAKQKRLAEAERKRKEEAKRKAEEAKNREWNETVEFLEKNISSFNFHFDDEHKTLEKFSVENNNIKRITGQTLGLVYCINHYVAKMNKLKKVNMSSGGGYVQIRLEFFDNAVVVQGDGRCSRNKGPISVSVLEFLSVAAESCGRCVHPPAFSSPDDKNLLKLLKAFEKLAELNKKRRKNGN